MNQMQSPDAGMLAGGPNPYAGMTPPQWIPPAQTAGAGASPGPGYPQIAENLRNFSAAQQAPRSSDSVAGQGGPPPPTGGYQPGSFSAGVAALNRNDPNARNMLGAAAGLPPQTGTYSSQGPQGPAPRAFGPGQSNDTSFGMRDYASPPPPQFTPNQLLMMQSGRGQRGFWQGPTSPFGMQGPWGRGGGGGIPYMPPGAVGQGVMNWQGPNGGMQNGAPK
jgi:hypothetical protein